MCLVWAYSNKPSHASACTSLPNQRKILCMPGYHVAGMSSETIVLTGNAAFPGCTQIGTLSVTPRPAFTGCALYGVPGKPANTNSWVWAND